MWGLCTRRSATPLSKARIAQRRFHKTQLNKVSYLSLMYQILPKFKKYKTQSKFNSRPQQCTLFTAPLFMKLSNNKKSPSVRHFTQITKCRRNHGQKFIYALQ